MSNTTDLDILFLAQFRRHATGDPIIKKVASLSNFCEEKSGGDTWTPQVYGNYSGLLKLNDFNEMSAPAARTQLLNLTNVASSLCRTQVRVFQFVDFSLGFCIALGLV